MDATVSTAKLIVHLATEQPKKTKTTAHRMRKCSLFLPFFDFEK